MQAAKTLLRFVADLFVGRFQRIDPSSDEAYLAQSVDMADLERRMQHLGRETVSNASARLSAMAWARG